MNGKILGEEWEGENWMREVEERKRMEEGGKNEWRE